MACLRDSWRTSLPASHQPRNPLPESIARNPYDPGRYQPLIRQNEHGQVIARDWVAGFMDGVALRFHGWQALLKSKEYRNDFAPIAVHLTHAQGNSPLNPEEENGKALIEQAAELIPAAVRSIYRFFKQTRPFFEG